MISLPVWTDRKVEDLIGNLLRAGVFSRGSDRFRRGGRLPREARRRARRLSGIPRRTEPASHHSRRIAGGFCVSGARHHSAGIALADCDSGRPRRAFDRWICRRARPHVCGVCDHRAGDLALQSFRDLHNCWLDLRQLRTKEVPPLKQTHRQFEDLGLAHCK